MNGAYPDSARSGDGFAVDQAAPILDESRLVELQALPGPDGNPLDLRLVSRFLEVHELEIDAIEARMTAEAREEAGRFAHAQKSATAALGGARLSMIYAAIERQARGSGNLDPQLIATCRREARWLACALQRYLDIRLRTQERAQPLLAAVVSGDPQWRERVAAALGNWGTAADAYADVDSLFVLIEEIRPALVVVARDCAPHCLERLAPDAAPAGGVWLLPYSAAAAASGRTDLSLYQAEVPEFADLQQACATARKRIEEAQ
jgi:HPt (histidine-containing phosphotransfer) domain-containing protein